MSTDGDTTIQERLARAEAALEEALAERAELWHELNRRRAVEDELRETRQELAFLRASPSWRVTAPLRRAKATYVRYRSLAAKAAAKLRDKA